MTTWGNAFLAAIGFGLLLSVPFGAPQRSFAAEIEVPAGQVLPGSYAEDVDAQPDLAYFQFVTEGGFAMEGYGYQIIPFREFVSPGTVGPINSNLNPEVLVEYVTPPFSFWTNSIDFQFFFAFVEEPLYFTLDQLLSTDPLYLTTPFTFSGFAYVAYNNEVSGTDVYRAQLVGQGTAYYTIATCCPLGNFDGGEVQVTDIRYEFETPEPTPEPSEVPEPATWSLLLLGLAVASFTRRSRS